jgi:hypothetical protein
MANFDASEAEVDAALKVYFDTYDRDKVRIESAMSIEQDVGR